MQFLIFWDRKRSVLFPHGVGRSGTISTLNSHPREFGQATTATSEILIPIHHHHHASILRPIHERRRRIGPDLELESDKRIDPCWEFALQLQIQKILKLKDPLYRNSNKKHYFFSSNPRNQVVQIKHPNITLCHEPPHFIHSSYYSHQQPRVWRDERKIRNPITNLPTTP